MSKKRLKIEDYLDRLKAWAVAGGAEAQANTNSYELLRLRVVGGVAIVWRKENGKQTWNNLALRLRSAHDAGESLPDDLRIAAKTPYNPNKRQRSVTEKTLIERDGKGCFFCFEEADDDMTVEHLVPRAHGGPNHISNKFRACSPCNMRAGNLSAPEKIRIREANLLKRAERVTVVATLKECNSELRRAADAFVDLADLKHQIARAPRQAREAASA